MRLWTLVLVVLPIHAFAEVNTYRWEIGVHGGAGYYIGELTPYKLNNGLEALTFGAHVRRKIDERWALQARGIMQSVAGVHLQPTDTPVDTISFHNPLLNIDITADFNFFDFGDRNYDITKVSPYIFAGVGCAMFIVEEIKAEGSIKFIPKCVPYIPIGLGVKWKFHDRLQLQLAWQHNIHLRNGDFMEGVPNEYPSHQTGNNVLRNDVTSTITAAFIVEFAKPRHQYHEIRY